MSGASRVVIFIVGLSLAVVAVAWFSLFVFTQTSIPKFPLPVAMTAPGQSPEYAVVKLFLDRAKIPVKSDPLLEPGDIGDARSLIIIIGGSGKGLGAAGMDIEDEVKRARDLLALAKERKMPVIGMHLGGEARRGPNSQKFIELVTPNCNFVIVRSDGNKDGIFTKITQDHKIPLLLIEKTTELNDILAKMFK